MTNQLIALNRGMQLREGAQPVTYLEKGEACIPLFKEEDVKLPKTRIDINVNDEMGSHITVNGQKYPIGQGQLNQLATTIGFLLQDRDNGG